MKESVTQYKDVLKDIDKYQDELDILNSNNIDLNKVKNVNDYLEQRSTIIQTLNKRYNDEQKAVIATDAYLKNNYRKLFTQFD